MDIKMLLIVIYNTVIKAFNRKYKHCIKHTTVFFVRYIQISGIIRIHMYLVMESG